MTSLPAGRLVGTGPTGNLFCVRSDGSGNVAIADLVDPEGSPSPPLDRAPGAYVWPLWLAGGATVLTSTIELPRAGRPPAQLLRLAADGSTLDVLYSNAEGTGAVGPDLPHYVNPSPDGKHVTVLSQATIGGLVLLFVDANGRGPAQPVARGAPLFSAWSPSSDALLVHVGGELSLMELASAPAMRVLATNHVAYRVPAWAPDGSSLAAAAPAGSGVAVQVLGRDGRMQHSLTTVDGIAAFGWSPDGNLLACASGRASNPPVYSDLKLIPAAGGDAVPARVGDSVAFVWSPDGTYLGVLVPEPREARVAWLVVGRDGRVVRRFPPFRPSGELSTYVGFFDQYALSHRLWAPDGSAILGCGRVAHNGTPPELSPSRIYSFDIATGDAVELAAGAIAFWSEVAG